MKHRAIQSRRGRPWRRGRALAGLLTLCAAASAQQGEAPPRLALLVGVDHYAPGASAPPDLAGCANDVARMRSLLMERFGFPAEGIRTLVDQQATHAAIVRAFEEHLLDRATAGSPVVLYLSGHGSRIPDASGVRDAEPDGYDSTFLAHDSRAGAHDGDRDLTDDELRSLLAALTARTDQVVVIMDTCHSGGAVRGHQRERARSAPQGAAALDREWLDAFWPQQVPLLEDAAGAALDPARYLQVAAAERDQRAWELDVTDLDGQPASQGALTYFLSEALDRATPETTWREVVDDVAVRVAARRVQTVHVVGGADRTVFGGEFKAAAGFRAEALRGQLLVRAGALIGLRVGSQLELRSGAGELLGHARVTAVTPTVSRAAWEKAPDSIPEGALRALELSRGASELPLAVCVTVEGLELPTDLALLRAVARHEAEYELVEAADGLRLRTLDGVDLHARPLERAEGLRQALEDVARLEARWRALSDLAAVRGRYPLRLSIRPATEAEAAEVNGNRVRRLAPVQSAQENPASERFVTLRWDRGTDASAPSRSLAAFELQNLSDRDLHVALISLEEKRAVTLGERELFSQLFPTRESWRLLEAGASVEELFLVRGYADWPADRPMRDRYLVLASDRPFDLGALKHVGTDRGDGDGLPRILEELLTAELTRGEAPASLRRWGFACVDVFVE